MCPLGPSESLTCCANCVMQMNRKAILAVKIDGAHCSALHSLPAAALLLLSCSLTPGYRDSLGVTSFFVSCKSIKIRVQESMALKPLYSCFTSMPTLLLILSLVFMQVSTVPCSAGLSSHLSIPPWYLSMSLPILYSSSHYDRVLSFFILKERTQ